MGATRTESPDPAAIGVARAIAWTRLPIYVLAFGLWFDWLPIRSPVPAIVALVAIPIIEVLALLFPPGPGTLSRRITLAVQLTIVPFSLVSWLLWAVHHAWDPPEPPPPEGSVLILGEYGQGVNVEPMDWVIALACGAALAAFLPARIVRWLQPGWAFVVVPVFVIAAWRAL
jgi:hypothetical protein